MASFWIRANSSSLNRTCDEYPACFDFVMVSLCMVWVLLLGNKIALAFARVVVSSADEFGVVVVFFCVRFLIVGLFVVAVL